MSGGALEPEAVRQALNDHGFSDLADEIVTSLRPSIRLTTTPVSLDSLPRGASRLGGLPDLPAGWELPKLSFVAQINLADAAPFDVEQLLPDRGWLYFFYDAENQPWGEPDQAGGWQVLYAPETAPLHRAAPDALPTEMPRFPVCALSFSPALTTLPVDYFVRYFKPGWQDLEEPDWDRLEKLLELLGELSLQPKDTVHRMLGHPDPVQGSVEREWAVTARGLALGDRQHPLHAEFAASAPDWRLLLQVDSDSPCRMMWGDVGRIYYGIHKDDLASRNFAAVWLSMQCS